VTACALFLLALGLPGCGGKRATTVTFRWWVARTAPSFDPDGPPDAVRAAIERLLTRSLVEEDTLGKPVLVAARNLTISPDRLRYTFEIRDDLKFTDGTPCRSQNFLDALEAGLGRKDHATREWLLGAVRGVDAVRAGRQLPVLGIDAPDPRTLVLQLARPDSMLLAKLAVPGASAAWAKRDSATDWSRAVGLGPYRVAKSDGLRLTLVRTRKAGPDTVAIRFGLGGPRARAQLRAGGVDLMWPCPSHLLDDGVGPPFRAHTRAAAPSRLLALVMRADVPPTTKLAARRALANGFPRAELTRTAGLGSREIQEWMPGSGAPAFPNLDLGELQNWLERGKLGRSFHVTLAFEADGPAADLARTLQGEWARHGLYVDLQPLRGRALREQMLSGQAQGLLAEYQGLTRDAAGNLAPLVMPMRGPAVGSFRTGWRTREFDPWLWPRRAAPPLNASYVERRLEEETIVLPLVELSWVWLAREGGPQVSFHPRFGPSAADPLVLSNFAR
jgi:ABC-type transport system substrate-binding protein